MNQSNYSESDVKEKFITPANIRAGWDELTQIRREVYFTSQLEIEQLADLQL